MALLDDALHLGTAPLWFGCGANDDADETEREKAISACESYCEWTNMCDSSAGTGCACEGQYDIHAEQGCLDERVAYQICRDEIEKSCSDNFQGHCLPESNAFEDCEL